MNAVDQIKFSGPDELAQAAAVAWVEEIECASRAGKLHNVALSGGRISQKFFSCVAAECRKRVTKTECIHFFWADERCVPPTDPESNYRIARELLFLPLNISEEQLHRIHGELPPDEAAKFAEAELCRIVQMRKDGQPELDLVFLGLGEDGHVASLFPEETEAGWANPAAYRAIFNSPKPPPRRVTMGSAAIAAAKSVWMLASGAGKENALRLSLGSDQKTPFGRVLKSRERTRLFTDIALQS